MSTDNQRGILRASGIVTFASVFLYLFWYLREYAVSARLGAGREMDAFLVAYSIPLFIGSTFSGVLQILLVPAYLSAKKEGADRRQRFCNEVFGALLVVVIIVSAALAIAVPWVSRTMGSGFDGAQVQLVMRLTWMMLPLAGFLAFFGVAGAFLVAEQQFWANGILPAISSIAPALTVWFFSHRFGVYSFAVGLTVGWGAQLFIALVLVRRLGIGMHLSLRWERSQVANAIRLSGPLILGIVGTGLVPIIDRAMASGLPTGSISALGYAERLLTLIMAIFASVQTAVFPFFAEQANRGDITSLRGDFLKTTGLSLFIALPATVILGLFGVPVVRLLFGHGVFDLGAVELTGQTLMAYSLSIAAAVVGNIIVRVVNAFQDSWTIGILGIMNPMVKILLNVLLFRFGAVGFALAYSGMTLWTTLLLMWRVRRHVTPVTESWFWKNVAKIGTAFVGMWAFARLLQGTPQSLSPVWLLFFQIGSASALYVVISWILRLDSARYVSRALWERLAKLGRKKDLAIDI